MDEGLGEYDLKDVDKGFKDEGRNVVVDDLKSCG